MFFASQPRRPLIFAHRGCSSLAPENTLVAARKARAAGAHGWELDVQLTADGQLIVQHDRALLRVTDVRRHPAFVGRQPYVTSRFTLAELQQLSTGEAFARYDRHGQIAAGKVTAADLAAFRREPMPSLTEALALTRELDMVVNVELKSLAGLPGADTLVKRTAAVLEEMGMPERILISSFNFDYLREIKRLRPEYATAPLVHRAHPDPVALMRELGAEAYHPGQTMITPQSVARIRQAGLHVNVWTVNDGRRMRELASWGVSGIITDFPQRWEGAR